MKTVPYNPESLEHNESPHAISESQYYGLDFRPDDEFAGIHPSSLPRTLTDALNQKALAKMHPGNRFRLIAGLPLLPG